MRRLLLILGVVAFLAGGCTGGDERASDTTEPSGPTVTLGEVQLASSLQTFDRCAELLEFAKEHARAEAERAWFGRTAPAPGNDVAMSGRSSALTASGGEAATVEAAGAATAAPPAADTFSGTNVQEQGVDEPDLVKTDGRRLVVLNGSRLHVIDVSEGKPTARGSLSVADSRRSPTAMLLDEDRLLVFSHGYSGPAEGRLRGWGAGGTTITVVDIADPAKPSVVEELQAEGDYVDARLIDGVARVVLRSHPYFGPEIRSFDDMTIDDWLPSYQVDGERKPLVECDQISHPAEPTNLGTVAVVTIDPDDPRIGPAAAVLGAGDTVYASATSLYVATQPRFELTADRRSFLPETHLHRFDISDREKASYVASGRVPGRVLNQFSLSEHEGRLRVATTDDSKQESAVTILEQDGDELVVAGSVGGLGRNEQIHAVRFMGDLGYVVTFRRTDPLYVLDLSDARKPELKGELKIPGYSAYLHPAGDGRLIGVGQDATLEGRATGTQISLFDVSDPAKPTRLQQATIPGASSEVEHDHHAFLWWDPSDLAVVPIMGDFGPGAAVGFRVDDGAIREVGRVTHPGSAMVRRSVVVGDVLYTVSEAGVMASDLRSLAQRGWVSLPS